MTRRRALLAGGAGLAALTGGGFWLASRGETGTPGVLGTTLPSNSPTPSATASPAASVSPSPSREAAGTVPVQPGAPGIEHASLTETTTGLVSVNVSHWWSWALMDRSSGRIIGSPNFHQTNMTASMIKAWLAADYLRRATESGTTPSTARMNMISTMIRDSANEPASTLYGELGRSATIGRLVSICKLTDSRAGDGWSTTQLSARDTCRIANCIGNGTAAGPRWTTWLVNEMRNVRGDGDFGIRRAWPADEQKTIAIKNGWVDRQALGFWTVNCMALGDTWTMAVMTRPPLSKPWSAGGDIARSVATQLRTATDLV
ncbi:hypothetical protein Cs7R123_79110 [Catellatospora sp. TT07R-123]|uniref:hypothetical protein n=1 Tax=Catellatospora sp. TT07R-123 TaxID=2733863 RepID=UPI001B06CA93|nr:hypothetical protein [Catellatospora sp. TT07R-123]GHJ50569.1 hypothetical protein Cs7R123_79110 [Catellatospora sp. TT07R-123]